MGIIGVASFGSASTRPRQTRTGRLLVGLRGRERNGYPYGRSLRDRAQGNRSSGAKAITTEHAVATHHRWHSTSSACAACRRTASCKREVWQVYELSLVSHRRDRSKGARQNHQAA